MTVEHVDKLIPAQATELEYLTWFRQWCDFGPAHGDVIDSMNEQFVQQTGKQLPDGWGPEEE